MSFKKILINIGISIGIGTLTFLGFFFISRSRSDRRGIQSDNGVTDRIESGNQTIETGLGELDERLESHTSASESITDRSSSIETKLQSAIDILRKAKEKS